MDLTKEENRKALIKMIDGESEKSRIRSSIFECDILEGKIESHLNKKLLEKYDSSTIKEMPVITKINMAKRISFEEASLYREAPDRSFKGIEEKDDDYVKLVDIYKDGRINAKLLRANKYFKHQLQCALYVLPIDGKIEVRVLKKHQYFHFDGVYLLVNDKAVNSKMKDQEKKKARRITVWSKEYNFVMDGDGDITSTEEDLSNPIGIIPIIDISIDKDDEFWVTSQRGVAEFTIDLNLALTALIHVMHMQGFAIGAISGSIEMLQAIASQTIGLNKLLKLPITTDKDGNQVSADAKFISPNPDLPGSIAVIETMLSAFMTSEGVDPKIVSLKGEGESYSSGWERLLALLSKFEASKEDVEIFKRAETQLLEVIKAYITVYATATNPPIDKKYLTSGLEDVSVYVDYKSPEMIETRGEKEDRIKKREDNGFASRVDSIMEIYKCDRKEAIKIIMQIEEDKKILAPKEEVVLKDEGEDEI
jgi:hypothetical protein